MDIGIAMHSRENKGRCPRCNSMAHGKFSAKCHHCKVDKTEYGYIVPKRKPFRNFLHKVGQ